MASNRVGISFQEIQSEQESIDKLIDSLLNTDHATSSYGSISARNKEINTPVSKRGRGRPAKSSVNSSSSPAPRAADNKLSLDSIVECLQKLNSQNQKLLQYVQTLSENVNNGRCNCDEAGVRSLNTNEINDRELIDVGISNRLEKIEQNLNSNVLICKGPEVSELIKQVKTGSSVNYEGLKGNLCKAICGDEVREIDIRNLRVSLFGYGGKSIKVDCANSSSKLHILKQARLKKPIGIYASEFLTKSKLQIIRNLRNLRKLHPSKIKSVYTREGNIFYRLEGLDRAVMVKSNREIENIFRDVPSTMEVNIPTAAEHDARTPVDATE